MPGLVESFQYSLVFGIATALFMDHCELSNDFTTRPLESIDDIIYNSNETWV